MTSAPATQTTHATCVIAGTIGILIRGVSGSGKSALADMLLTAARAKGHFAALIADDRVILTANAGRLIGRAPDALKGLMEVRGHGIVNVPYEPSARIGIVADLKELPDLERLPDDPVGEAVLEGINVPAVPIPKGALALQLRQVRWALRAAYPGVPDYI